MKKPMMFSSDTKTTKGGPALRKPTHTHITLAVFLACLFATAVTLHAEETVHTVVKGDTLWDISMKYLRTPWKWPLVWADNQDITNPHLIYPGDMVVITRDGDRTIFKIIPSPERPAGEREMTVYTPQEAASVRDKSIVLAPQFSLYMYSPNKLSGTGEVIRKTDGGDFISENDGIVIRSSSSLRKDQIVTLVTKIQDISDSSGDPAGYLYRITGTARIEETMGDSAKARVFYSLQESRVGSIVFDDIPAIRPVPLNITEPRGVTATVMDHHGGIMGGGTFDLVFLDAGKNRGIEKGALLSLYRKTPADDGGSGTAMFHDQVGIVVVIQSLDSSSMGLVVQSKEVITKGIVAMGRN